MSFDITVFDGFWFKKHICYQFITVSDETPPKKRRLNANDSTEVILIGPHLDVSPSKTDSPTSAKTTIEKSPRPQDTDIEPVTISSSENNGASVPSASTSAVQIDDIQLASLNTLSDTSLSTSDIEFKEENETERKLLKKIELSVLMLLDYFKEGTPNPSLLLESPPKPRNSLESLVPLIESVSPKLTSSLETPIEALSSATIDTNEKNDCHNQDEGNV